MADNLWDKFLKAVFRVRETSLPPIVEPVIPLAEEYVDTAPSIWEQEITLTPPAEAPELAVGQEYLDRQMTYALQKTIVKHWKVLMMITTWTHLIYLPIRGQVKARSLLRDFLLLTVLITFLLKAALTISL